MKHVGRFGMRAAAGPSGWRSLLLALLLVGAYLAPLATAGAEPKDGIDPRIVGGTVVPPGTYPFIVYIVAKTKQGAWLCGGTLIAANKVLTAGHCVTNDRGGVVGPKAYTVTLERNNRKARRTGATRKVVAVDRHPQFRYGGNLPYDVAVLTLKSSVSGIDPIRMPTAQDDLPGQAAIVAGWGATREGGRPKNLMRQTTLDVMDPGQCSAKLKLEGAGLGREHLCAFATHSDSCQGDSGGPLFLGIGDATSDPENFVQIGVVSWGFGCGRKYPGVYTRLSDPVVADFIEQRAGLAPVEP